MDIQQITHLFETTEGACMVLASFAVLAFEQWQGMKANKQKFRPEYLQQWLYAAIPNIVLGAALLKEGMPVAGAIGIGILVGIVGTGVGQWGKTKMDRFIEGNDPMDRLELELSKGLGRIGIKVSDDEVADAIKGVIKKLRF